MTAKYSARDIEARPDLALSKTMHKLCESMRLVFPVIALQGRRGQSTEVDEQRRGERSDQSRRRSQARFGDVFKRRLCMSEGRDMFEGRDGRREVQGFQLVKTQIRISTPARRSTR